MSKKSIYWTGGIIISFAAIYFFAPPLVDMSGRGSRFNQWLHRNDPLKGVKGTPNQYGANSDNPTTHNPVPVAGAVIHK